MHPPRCARMDDHSPRRGGNSTWPGGAMKITGMNHFNVLTDDVDAARAFYVGILGLTEGERPPLKFPGLWLYAGGQPILHISGARLPKDRAGVIDHIAFSTTDLKGTVARLKEKGIEHS